MGSGHDRYHIMRSVGCPSCNALPGQYCLSERTGEARRHKMHGRRRQRWHRELAYKRTVRRHALEFRARLEAIAAVIADIESQLRVIDRELADAG